MAAEKHNLTQAEINYFRGYGSKEHGTEKLSQLWYETKIENRDLKEENKKLKSKVSDLEKLIQICPKKAEETLDEIRASITDYYDE